VLHGLSPPSNGLAAQPLGRPPTLAEPLELNPEGKALTEVARNLGIALIRRKQEPLGLRLRAVFLSTRDGGRRELERAGEARDRGVAASHVAEAHHHQV